MGWSIGYDQNWKRDVGYGVPAMCDHPDCNESIDRGLSYVCGGDIYGGEFGCGLYFCQSHLSYGLDKSNPEDPKISTPQLCSRCHEALENPEKEVELFEPTPDVPRWILWKLSDPSWAEWRKDEIELVNSLRSRMESHCGDWESWPIGSRAISAIGGYWIRVPRGWQWCTGATFPTPGGDVVRMELP